MVEQQGEAVSETNVDDLMRQTMALMKKELEPFAVDHFSSTSEMAAISMAVSMKRIADSHDTIRMAMAGVNDACFKLPTGINSLCTILDKVAAGSADIKSALWKIEYALEHNDGRELRITIAKD